MPRDKINNKVEENTWTKYVPPTKRRNKSNNKNKNKDKSNVDLFNPDMFPTLNNNEQNNNIIKQKNNLSNHKELFNNDVIIDTKEDEVKNNDMLILTKENIKKYKEDKIKLQEIYEDDLEQLNERAITYITEILNRENERRAMLEDLYGEGYFEEYIPEEFPYYTTTDDEEENNSFSSFDDDDDYYDEHF